jgi:fructose-1-phosphate kinase PfkB-like protein
VPLAVRGALPLQAPERNRIEASPPAERDRRVAKDTAVAAVMAAATQGAEREAVAMVATAAAVAAVMAQRRRQVG